ncbi:MAG: hypothetical protein ACUVUR_02380 [bacterium]
MPPGRKRLQGRKDVDPLWDLWHAPDYKEFALRTGGLPEGNYTFIVLLQPDLGGDTIEFNVRLPGPPRLISPRNGTSLPQDQRQPMFNWTPSLPNLRYQLRIVEVLSGQTKEEAMRGNQPWYEGRNLTTNVLRYPFSATRFELGKQFAWQVWVLDRDGRVLGESEIWTFLFEEVLRPPVGIPPPVSITHQVTRTNNYYRVQLTIQNQSPDTFCNLTVFDRSSGLQCLDDASVMHGTIGASYRSTACSTWTDNSGRYSAIRFSWERLNPRGNDDC